MKNLIKHSIAFIIMLALGATTLMAQEESQTITIEDDKIVIKQDSVEIILDRKNKTTEVEVEKEVEERILQDENGVVEDDEIEIRIGDDHDHDHDHDGKKKKKNKFRVGMLDYGISTYLVDGSLNHDDLEGFALNHGKSNNFNLHIFRHRVHLLGDVLFFEYGLSTNWRRYSLKNDVIIDKEAVGLSNGPKIMTWTESATDNKKNKLRSTYLEIPVMLTISPKDSKFFISAGMFGGMRIGGSQKIKNKDEGKTVVKGDYEMRDFNTGVVGRIGFGPVDFYCQYTFDTLFNDDVNPELTPISFGISVLGF